MRMRPLLPLLLAVALAVGACSGEDVPEGGIRVSVSTEGSNPDVDGYLVVVGERTPEPIDENGELLVSDLPVGEYTILLEGVAPQCYVAGSNSRSITVEANVVAIASFVVACPVGGGSVRLVTVTTGTDLDPDGYGVRIGNVPMRQVAANGNEVIQVGGLGRQPVVVHGVADNCTPSPSNPAEVDVADRPRTEVRLAFECSAITGSVVVTVTATGEDVPTTALTLSVDGTPHSILVGVPLTVRSLPPGTYMVYLKVPGNCAVEGHDARMVAVAIGASTPVAFGIRCTPLPRVVINAVTLGESPDPDGYVVTLTDDYYYYYESRTFTAAVPSNGTAEIRGVPAGTWLVSVTGIAPNCRVRNVPPWIGVGTVDVVIELEVDCAVARTVAYAGTVIGSDTDIHFVNTTGQGYSFAAAGADSNPAWARSGGELAFTSHRDGNAEIYRVNADGSGVTRLTTDAASDYRPAWSPDGTRIAFVSDRDGNAEIYVMNRDGSGVERLTSNGAWDVEPAWSPDGTRLVFASTRDGGIFNLYVMNADGSGVTRLTSGSQGGDRTPAWSPDGSLVAFSRSTGVGHQLYVVTAAGFLPRALASIPSIAPMSPDWSRDGFQIVFSFRYCDGFFGCNSGLYILDLAGLGLTELPVAAQDASDPAWRP